MENNEWGFDAMRRPEESEIEDDLESVISRGQRRAKRQQIGGVAASFVLLAILAAGVVIATKNSDSPNVAAPVTSTSLQVTTSTAQTEESTTTTLSVPAGVIQPTTDASLISKYVGKPIESNCVSECDAAQFDHDKYGLKINGDGYLLLGKSINGSMGTDMTVVEVYVLPSMSGVSYKADQISRNGNEAGGILVSYRDADVPDFSNGDGSAIWTNAKLQGAWDVNLSTFRLEPTSTSNLDLNFAG